MLKRLLGCLAALIFTACAAPPELAVRYDWTAIFAGYKSWQWLDGQPVVADAIIGGDLTDTFIRRAVTRELERKGLALVMTDPDLLVNYRGNIEQAVSSEPAKTGYGYNWRWSQTEAGEWKGKSLARGTLVIELIDARTRNLVWRGSLNDAVSDRSEMQSQIPAAVRTILAEYPPRPQ